MAREANWGTPGRTPHYAHLRSKYTLFGIGFALGLLTILGFGFFDVIGLRTPLTPGSVTSGHSGIESRCIACHAQHEASDLRCQRCHDGGGAGRLTLASHAYFGSGNAKKAAAAGTLACARCHIEHRGARVRLADVNEGQCLACHAVRNPERAGQSFRIPAFGSHPEFKVIRDQLEGDPRLRFSHARHMKEVVKEGAAGEWDTCVRCHVPENQGRDLQKINFDTHCARCHNDELAMDPVPAQDVALDVPSAGGLKPGADGTVQKTGIRHKDEWVLYNVRKLQWELYPQAYARDRNVLLARASQLERELYQAQPLSGLSLDGLQQRQAVATEELSRLESRERVSSKVAPEAGLDRIAEIVQAAGQGGDETLKGEAEAASREAAALRTTPPKTGVMPEDEFDQRRQEILNLLDALGTTDPGRRRSVEDLRRRLLALNPGDTAAESLKRAIDQRKVDLERIRDEIALRTSSEPLEVRTLPEQLALKQDLKDARETLAKYYSFGGPAPNLSSADKTRKLDTLEKLSGAGKGEHCAKCHVLNEGALLPQRAAQKVMVRATFNHLPHLDAPLPQPSLAARVVSFFKREPSALATAPRTRCAVCHQEMPKAGDAPRKPSIPAIVSCQTCHRSGATRTDCQLCHRFHPPGVAS